ncbi:MAG TPA: hypothetical protein VFK57_25290 [Vicinamibacterales bacterium]|nr:hypothetical protein [Vicinamibacterales bacterium]
MATVTERVRENVGGNLQWTLPRLTVTKTLLGTVPASVTMMPAGGGPDAEEIAAARPGEMWSGRTSCDYVFVVGREYLVYARRLTDGRWTTSECDGTKQLSEARADLDFIAGLPAVNSPARLIGRIERSVRDPKNRASLIGVPAPNVKVSINSASSSVTVATDADGKFELPLAPGAYIVAPRVPKGARRLVPERIIARERGCVPVHFSLMSNGAIEGRVIRQDGSPVRRVRVGVIPADVPENVRPVSGNLTPTTFTDDLGRFTIELLPPGQYLLAVNPRPHYDPSPVFATAFYPTGARQQAQAIDVREGERKEHITFRVTSLPETTVSGRVVFNDRPISGATVSVAVAEGDGRSVSSATSGRDGTFRLRVIAGANYVIRAFVRTDTGYQEGHTRIPVTKPVDGVRIALQPAVKRDRPRQER